MDISLGDVKAFREVARQGTVSAASRCLSVSQPSLSWTIKKLEEDLGTPLFLRSNKGVALTRAGKIFYERSGELERNWEDLKDVILSESGEVRGSYVLGVYGTMAGFTLPQFCGRLLSDYPNLELRLVHDLSRQIAEGVINYEIDFGIVVNPPRHPDLTILELYRDEVKFWIKKNPSPLQDAANPNSLLVLNREMRQSSWLVREATRSGLINSGRTLYTTDLTLIRSLVAAGTGIGLIPRTIALSQPEDELVCLPGGPVQNDMICLIYRGEARKTRAGQVIKDIIVESLRQDLGQLAEKNETAKTP